MLWSRGGDSPTVVSRTCRRVLRGDGTGYRLRRGCGVGTNNPFRLLEINVGNESGDDQIDGLRIKWGPEFPTLYGEIKRGNVGSATCDGTTWADASSREYKENIEVLTESDPIVSPAFASPIAITSRSDGGVAGSSDHRLAATGPVTPSVLRLSLRETEWARRSPWRTRGILDGRGASRGSPARGCEPGPRHRADARAAPRRK